MAGASSIIKSSTFDGVDVGGGSYANATTGWLINGSGRAYFYDASVAGSIDIGGFDSGSFHVDSEGNMWLGSGVFATGTFRVTKEGDAYANSLTTNTLDLKGNTEIGSNGKIYLGVGVYNNTNTPFYVDDISQFSLGDKLTWDGTTLTVKGVIKLADDSSAINANTASNIANTAVSGLESDIYSDGFIGGLTINSTQMYYGAGSFAAADTAFYVAKNTSTGQANFSLGDKLTWNGSTLSITGNVVITGGSTFTSIETAQSTANTAQSTANTANTTANNANTLASTKISAGDIQVSLDNGTTIIRGSHIETGSINADRITAGTLSASQISGGTISGVTFNARSLYLDFWRIFRNKRFIRYRLRVVWFYFWCISNNHGYHW